MIFIRKFAITILLLSVLSSCVNEENKLITDSKLASIDSLFEKINNGKLESNERSFYVKELKNRLGFLKYDTLVRKRYIDLSLLYFQSNNTEQFKKISEYVDKVATENSDTLGQIQAKCFLATYYTSKFKNDSAYFYYSKAEKLSKKIKQKPFLGSVLMNKAELLTYHKDFAGAETLATQALRIGNAKKDISLVYSCYLILGKSLKGLNNDKEAMNYYLKALKKTDELKDDFQFLSLKAQMYNYIALLKIKQEDYNSSISFAKEGLSLDNFKRSQPAIYCYLKNTLAYSKFKLGDESCLKDFYETLKIGDSLGNIHIQLNSKLNFAEFYLKKSDHIRAKDYSFEVLELAKKNKIFEDELKALELLAKIDPKSSQSYNERYINLSDSLQNVERATRNKFARIEFETDEITSEKKVVEAENKRMAAQILAILGFSFFVITALVLLYIVKAQRSKNRELLHKQKQQQATFEIYQLMLDQQQKIEEGKQIEKQRISRELHDGIMGKLTAIRLNLFILNKKNDPETIARCMQHVDEIQNIEKEIRKIAHDLNQNLFADTSDFVLMVDNLVANIKEHSTARFTVMADEGIDWTTVSSGVKIQVYRILQESLQNIGKYAKAENVSITMLKKETTIAVSVTDDGVGFNQDQKINGIGLKNMKERAAEIGATLKILSEKNQGTQIILIIPT